MVSIFEKNLQSTFLIVFSWSNQDKKIELKSADAYNFVVFIISVLLRSSCVSRVGHDPNKGIVKYNGAKYILGTITTHRA